MRYTGHWSAMYATQSAMYGKRSARYDFGSARYALRALFHRPALPYFADRFCRRPGGRTAMYDQAGVASTKVREVMTRIGPSVPTSSASV